MEDPAGDCASNDLKIGRLCRSEIGADKADCLLGEFLRCHRPEMLPESARALLAEQAPEAEEEKGEANAAAGEEERKKLEAEKAEEEEKDKKKREAEEEEARKREADGAAAAAAAAAEADAAAAAAAAAEAEEKKRREAEEEEARKREAEEAKKADEEKHKRDAEEAERKQREAEEAKKEEEERAKREAEEEEKRKVTRWSSTSECKKLRPSVVEHRWDDEEDKSGDEALGVFSSIGRSMSLWYNVANIGMSMSMSSNPTTAGLQIANMCRKQGGIYVKFAQFASAMPFAFPQEVLEAFQALQDTADPQPWHIVSDRVKKNTPNSIDSVYENIEEVAMNAASIAQVHKGKRKTGDDVVLKILRKDIQQSYAHDTENFIYLLGMYETATGIQVKWLTEWQMGELKKEIDFRYEASLHEECSKFIASKQELRRLLAVPELHSELCRKKLLVMEYIDGCKITKAAQHFPDWNRDRDLPPLHEVVEMWFAMQVFLTGKFHGDPHPGNLMLRRNPNPPKDDKTCPFQVVAIDHGGYFELEDAHRKQFAECWLMMSEPKDEKQRLARRARLTEIFTSWGIAHVSRFVIEQMFAGNFSAKDPTGTVRENGDARMHKYNRMVNNNDEKGPMVFEDPMLCPPALMKACGCGNFTRAAWAELSKGMRGFDPQKIRITIMLKWAAKCPGVKTPP